MSGVDPENGGRWKRRTDGRAGEAVACKRGAAHTDAAAGGAPPRAAARGAKREKRRPRMDAAPDQHPREPASRGSGLTGGAAREGVEAGEIEIPTAQDDGDAPPDGWHLPAEKSGDARGTGAFHQQLGALKQEQDGVADGVVRHGHHVVGQLPDDGHRELAGGLYHEPVGERLRGIEVDGDPGVERLDGRVRSRRLHAHHAHLGVSRFHRDRDAGHQPAPADGDDEGVDRGIVLEDLEADRALACDDGGIVKSVDERPSFAGELPGVLVRLVVVLADEPDLGAVAPGCGDLCGGGVLGHDHGAGHAEVGGGQGDALGVVTGGGGDDAALPLGFRECGDLVEGAAEFERAGALQVLEFEVDLPAGQAAERATVRQRSAVGDASQDLAGGDNVFISYRPFLSSGQIPNETTPLCVWVLCAGVCLWTGDRDFKM